MTGAELLVSLGSAFRPEDSGTGRVSRGNHLRHRSRSDIREVAKFCKEELSFDYLLDISSVDNFGSEPRFEVVYELYSMTLGDSSAAQS